MSAAGIPIHGGNGQAVVPTPEEQTNRMAQAMPQLAQGISNLITEIAGAQQGFMLMAFTPLGVQFITNADRDAVATEMQKLIDMWAAGEADLIQIPRPM